MEDLVLGKRSKLNQMTKLLNKYKNGNAVIKIYDDGTRNTEWPDGEQLNLDFPLSIDLCITNYCKRGCLWCYNNSNPNGKHADIMNLKFIDSMPSGIEVAIGGGSATAHPDLIPFLEKLKAKGLIANLTVNQGELIENIGLINSLIDDELIHGLGVSFTEPQDLIYKNMAQPNMVVHLIAGIHGKEVLDYLSNFNLKILILGYKNIGRGYYYKDAMDGEIEKKIEWLKEHIEEYFDKFECVSFDNLSLKQLNIKDKLSKEEWQEFYQGDDGNISFYVDAINEKISKSSLETTMLPLKDDIREMFKNIKENFNKK
jgi:MoaA/NifB/PqqE/SkfB family radical SAM enzyme